MFSIENSTTFEQLDVIKEVLEISGLLKASSDKKKEKKVVLEKFEVDGYEIFLGKNSKQNDYLISKIANANDIWLHAYNCPSSHVLIKVKNDQKAPTPNVLEFGANLVKNNSPLKNSGKASVIYTLRKDLKKPPGGVLGYVIYKNEKEIIV